MAIHSKILPRIYDTPFVMLAQTVRVGDALECHVFSALKS